MPAGAAHAGAEARGRCAGRCRRRLLSRGHSAYLDFIRDPANGYVSVPFPVEDGMEISSWTTR